MQRRGVTIVITMSGGRCRLRYEICEICENIVAKERKKKNTVVAVINEHVT